MQATANNERDGEMCADKQRNGIMRPARLDRANPLSDDLMSPSEINPVIPRLIIVYLLSVCLRLEAHRALELLEDYHAKLTRPQDKQLRLAIERVIRIFKSRLFQALLGESFSYLFYATSHFLFSFPFLSDACRGGTEKKSFDRCQRRLLKSKSIQRIKQVRATGKLPKAACYLTSLSRR